MATTPTPASPKVTASAKKAPAPKRPSGAKQTSPVKAKRVAPPKAAPVKSQRAANTATVKPAAPAKVAQTVTSGKPKTKKEAAVPVVKDKKVKVVRDSFTIPKNEFAQIGDMKKKALSLGLDIKKSELIRAGLMVLTTASDAAFKKALAAVPTLKTGRPGKG